MAPLVVRVLPDVAAIDKTFDYLVPEPLRDQVRVGDMVRVELHGRRVGGWVTEVGATPPHGVELRPLAKRSGIGPPVELLELAGWAAWRWAGRTAHFLTTASPDPLVPALPARSRPARTPAREHHPLLTTAFAQPRSVLQVAPGTNLVPVALAAAALGNALVLCPTTAMAATMASRLRRAGVTVAVHPREWARGAAGTTVVGTRAAAWAPVADLAAVLVLDEHDEVHQQEQAPTWHARDVAVERARRAGVPCVLASPCPSLEALEWGRLHAVDRARARAGWPVVEVVDRRAEDPRQASLFSDALVRLLRSDQRVLCVLNRTGRARLLVCGSCGEVATCTHCAAAVNQPADDLVCPRCGDRRPAVCGSCGSARFRNVRKGVARVREELEALVGEPVGEVTAAGPSGTASARVVVGTEAVLRRIDRADAVAFLDLDQELLAPRYRAAEQALALVAAAARVVAASGPASGRAAGRLLLQTRRPDHEVVEAALHADASRVAAAERARRELLRFPPVTAMAELSGPAAGAYAERLTGTAGLEVVSVEGGRWLVRAPDHQRLCDGLAASPRPPGRLRVAVDPMRV